MMLKLGIGILLLSLTIVCVQKIILNIHRMGYHKTVYKHSPGPCRLIPGVDFGSEDMETLSDGRTFITSGLYSDVYPPEFKQYYEDNNVEGNVFFFDFKEPDKGVTKLTFSDDFDKTTFFPHGISLIQNDKTGKISLFVINHHPKADKIEQFEFNQEKMMLQHKKSYTDATMRIINDVAAVSNNSFYFTNFMYSRSRLGVMTEDLVSRRRCCKVNDVAAVSEDSFYFTNSVYSRSRLGVMAEDLLSLMYGSVVFFDGTEYKVVIDNMLYPNGIVLSKDLKNLYVASIGTASVQIYDRLENNELSLVEDFPVYTAADNLLIEPKSGNIITGAHPVLHLANQHMANPRLATPSQVLRLHMTNGSHVDRMTELYSDDGTFFSASSVASIYNDYMLVGSVLTKLMYCEIRYLPE